MSESFYPQALSYSDHTEPVCAFLERVRAAAIDPPPYSALDLYTTADTLASSEEDFDMLEVVSTLEATAVAIGEALNYPAYTLSIVWARSGSIRLLERIVAIRSHYLPIGQMIQAIQWHSPNHRELFAIVRSLAESRLPSTLWVAFDTFAATQFLISLRNSDQLSVDPFEVIKEFFPNALARKPVEDEKDNIECCDRQRHSLLCQVVTTQNVILIKQIIDIATNDAWTKRWDIEQYFSILYGAMITLKVDIIKPVRTLCPSSTLCFKPRGHRIEYTILESFLMFDSFLPDICHQEIVDLLTPPQDA